MKAVNIMAGPPSNSEDDIRTVEAFLSLEGRHFVCGGTTSNIVARCFNKSIDIPISVNEKHEGFPYGKIGGDIITTEGVITLKNIEAALKTECIPTKGSGEYLIYTALMESDIINIFLGRAKNNLHSGEIGFEEKEKSITYIKEKLTELKKTVNLYQN